MIINPTASQIVLAGNLLMSKCSSEGLDKSGPRVPSSRRASTPRYLDDIFDPERTT
jgi:hypothetical protein